MNPFGFVGDANVLRCLRQYTITCSSTKYIRIPKTFKKNMSKNMVQIMALYSSRSCNALSCNNTMTALSCKHPVVLGDYIIEMQRSLQPMVHWSFWRIGFGLFDSPELKLVLSIYKTPWLGPQHIQASNGILDVAANIHHHPNIKPFSSCSPANDTGAVGHAALDSLDYITNTGPKQIEFNVQSF